MDMQSILMALSITNHFGSVASLDVRRDANNYGSEEIGV